MTRKKNQINNVHQEPTCNRRQSITALTTVSKKAAILGCREIFFNMSIIYPKHHKKTIRTRQTDPLVCQIGKNMLIFPYKYGFSYQ